MNQNGSVYTPLVSEKQEIRLLRVLPSSKTSIDSFINHHVDASGPGLGSTSSTELIQCHLTTFPLHARNFIALSYQWGPADLQHDIIVNDHHRVAVRQNLWDFLNVVALTQRQQADTSAGDMLLWIDTLCIDQANIEERNEHVQVMDEIYKASTTVISWLGTGDPEIEAAFDLISRVWHDVDADTDGVAGAVAVVGADIDMTARLGDGAADGDIPDRLPIVLEYTEEEMWVILAKFCNLSYWARVWVAQEILLSSSNYLLYGTRTLSWQAFANFLSLVDIRYRCRQARCARIINNSTSKSFTAYKPYNMLPKRMEWKLGDRPLRIPGERWNRREYNLFRILTIFGGRECTDPLDHIYALLPLTTQGMHFPVKYGIDLMTLFLTTFHFCGLATYHESNVTPGPVYEPPSQRALLRNAKYLAETMEVITVYQKSSPYLTNTSPMSSSISSHSSNLDLRAPHPRTDPCFPCEGQWLSLRCTSIVPGSEPPVLRSNTLRRSIENVPFDVLVHVDDSSSWLMCRSNGPDQLVCTRVITLKDGPQGRGFKVIDPGILGRSAIAREPSSSQKWKMIAQPEAHLDFLNAIVLGLSTR